MISKMRLTAASLLMVLVVIGFSTQALATVPRPPALASDGSDLAAGEPTVWVEGLAIVDSLDLAIWNGSPAQVTVTVRGSLPDDCTVVSRVEKGQPGSNPIFIRLVTSRPAGEICEAGAVPYEEIFPVEVTDLLPGEYLVDVNGISAGFTLEALAHSGASQ